MKRYAMGTVVLMVASPGFLQFWGDAMDPIRCALLAVMLGWAALEFHIGLTRTFQSRMDGFSNRLSTFVCRTAWLFFTGYAWLDSQYQWSKMALPVGVHLALLFIFVLFLLLRLWSIFLLGLSFSYDIKPPESGIIVMTGPYKIIRHPAYLAVVILGSFPGLILESVIGFLGMLLTTLVPIVLRIHAEEKVMAKVMGKRFDLYRQHTFRLVPFLY